MSDSYYFDRQGRPIQSEEAHRLLADRDYKIIAQTTTPLEYLVSTVWLGVDMSHFTGDRPVIFETMVFLSRDVLIDVDCERYSSEAEARAGHERYVAKWSDPIREILGDPGQGASRVHGLRRKRKRPKS